MQENEHESMDEVQTQYQRIQKKSTVEARVSASVQTGPWGPRNPLFYRYLVSFPGVKKPERGINHPPPSNAEVKEKVELTPIPPLGLHGLF